MPCKELTTSLPSSLYKSSAVPLSHNGNHARPLPLHGRGGGLLFLPFSLSRHRAQPQPYGWSSGHGPRRPRAAGGGGGAPGRFQKRKQTSGRPWTPPARPARSLKNKPPPNGQNGTPHHQVAPQRSRSSLPRPGERRRGPFIPSYLRAETWATSPRQRLDDAGAGRAGGRRGPVEQEDRDRRRTGLALHGGPGGRDLEGC